jgi:hypothetical protein
MSPKSAQALRLVAWPDEAITFLRRVGAGNDDLGRSAKAPNAYEQEVEATILLVQSPLVSGTMH